MKLISADFKTDGIRVYCNPPFLGDEIHMFRSRGYTIVQRPEDADIVVFTGGADINPALYGEEPHIRTHFNYERDRRELSVYRKSKGKFKIGLCRGGQLLNVLSGGKLWQDIDQHHGAHSIRDVNTGQVIIVNSIHHQAFRPGKNAVTVAVTRLSTTKEAMGVSWVKHQLPVNHHHETDFEVLYYPETRCLCIQSHPEMEHADDAKNYFHELISRYYPLPVPGDAVKTSVG